MGQNGITQKQIKLNESSVFKDTSGNVIPFVVWNQLVYSGRYDFRPDKEKNTFIISRLSDEDYEKRIMAMPKPEESKFFRTGADFKHFKATDINGNKINTKDLKGKIIVLNFWFINCPPCQKEMPDLNLLAESFRPDSSVIFIAVALDPKNDLKDFLRSHPFGYQVVDDGRYITDQYRINTYPTNMIIDPAGKVYFHTAGLGMNTVYNEPLSIILNI